MSVCQSCFELECECDREGRFRVEFENSKGWKRYSRAELDDDKYEDLLEVRIHEDSTTLAEAHNKMHLRIRLARNHGDALLPHRIVDVTRGEVFVVWRDPYVEALA